MKEVAKYGFRASLVLLVATSAFNLGRYSVEFSGRPVAWTALVLSVIVLGMVACLLIFTTIPAGRGDLK